MSDSILVRFARKPVSIEEVKAVAEDTGIASYKVEVAETKQLSADEYDRFTDRFLRDHDWLYGKGGFKREVRQVIEVTAPERDTLYVDPSGYAYARYVGININQKECL